MSNRRKARRLLDVDKMRAATLAMARIEGCTCAPIVKFPTHPRAGQVTHAQVLHDEGCPLENRGPGAIGLVRGVESER